MMRYSTCLVDTVETLFRYGMDEGPPLKIGFTREAVDMVEDNFWVWKDAEYIEAREFLDIEDEMRERYDQIKGGE
jgi:hypothetical protein